MNSLKERHKAELAKHLLTNEKSEIVEDTELLDRECPHCGHPVLKNENGEWCSSPYDCNYEISASNG